MSNTKLLQSILLCVCVLVVQVQQKSDFLAPFDDNSDQNVPREMLLKYILCICSGCSEFNPISLSLSRSLLLLSVSTPSGSAAPSWLPCPPSSRCGSPSRSTTRPVLPSSTGSASKQTTISQSQPYICTVSFTVYTCNVVIKTDN